MKEFEIRRIFLSEETDQIWNMQKNAGEFIAHYPKHRQWLKMAIGEILNGKRVAFGVHKFGADHRKKHLSVELVGSIILKKKLYTKTIELKNLFIRNIDRRKGYGRVLFQKVEEYCAKSGYKTIETEAPCEEINTVRFLHKMGFRVSEMKASPYRDSAHIYKMIRPLYPLYGGDAFDFRAISLWVLGSYYGFNNIDEDHTGNEVELLIDAKGLKERVNSPNALPLRGAAFLFNTQKQTTENDIKRFVEKRNDNFSFVFAKSLDADAVRYCNNKNIKSFDEQMLIETFKNSFAYKPPNFSRTDIKGMVFVINPMLYKRIDKKKTSFAYFKGAPVGKYLKIGNKILFVSEPTPDYPSGGIKGIGEIDKLEIGDPEHIWNLFKKRNSLFEESEYNGFTSNKTQVIGFHITNYREINLVEYHILINDIIQEDVDLTELGHHYINDSMYNKFLSIVDMEKTMEDVKYIVALSFAGEDRAYAEKLAGILNDNNISVFYDSYEQADLWGKDLYQHLQKIYRDSARYCVVFLSEQYAKKLWTKHELKQAQARAFRENKEYILPVKIDDTEIPGINETIGYLDLRNLSITEIANHLIAKINKD